MQHLEFLMNYVYSIACIYTFSPLLWTPVASHLIECDTCHLGIVSLVPQHCLSQAPPNWLPHIDHAHLFFESLVTRLSCISAKLLVIVMGLDVQEVRRSINSYEGSAGIEESGRLWDLQQNSLRSVVEMVLWQIPLRSVVEMVLWQIPSRSAWTRMTSWILLRSVVGEVI